MRLPGLAVATLSVAVASATSSLASFDYEGPPGQKSAEGITCSTDSGETKTTKVTLPNTTVALSCGGTYTLKPTVVQQQPADKVCRDKACKASQDQVLITSLCPGATIKGGSSNREATITIPQLPTTTRVFYMLCEESSTTKCTAEITVQGAAPEGPQSCAVAGGSVTVQVPEEGGKAYFACGDDLFLYPKEDKKALSAECTKEETVKDLTREKTSTDNYVALTATKKGKKTLCYLCRQAKDMNVKDKVTERDCRVLVQLSGSTPLLSRLAFALTLPCVLTLVHFTP